MSAEFVFPEWMMSTGEPTRPAPADSHRVAHMVNRFIAAKQDALYEAPDAFYRRKGADALANELAVVTRLTDLRDAALRQASDEDRLALAAQLEAQLADATDGIGRHVKKERDQFAQDVTAERHRLIERAAALDPNDDEKLAGLAAANASVAQARAILSGEPAAPAIAAARSAVWKSAIDQRMATGQKESAQSLFERVKGDLGPADSRAQRAREISGTDTRPKPTR